MERGTVEEETLFPTPACWEEKTTPFVRVNLVLANNEPGHINMQVKPNNYARQKEGGFDLLF